MPSITLSIPYKANTNLVITPQRLLETYFFGIEQLTFKGQKYPNQIIEDLILAAQTEIEDRLDLKIFPQIIEESRDFNGLDWRAWGFISTQYPVVKANKMEGFVNTVRQITYPPEWLSVKHSNVGSHFRTIHLVPNGSTSEVQSSAVIYNGITPHLGIWGSQSIPNYWQFNYCTGWTDPPKDLVNFVGKLAAINLFHVLGDIILGAGIASQSISIDGLSQSISTTSSATNAGYGARITGYVDDLKKAWPTLKGKYKSVMSTVL